MFNLSKWNGQPTALCGCHVTSVVIFTITTKTLSKEINQQPAFIPGGGYNPTGHLEIQFKNREQMWSEPAKCT